MLTANHSTKISAASFSEYITQIYGKMLNNKIDRSDSGLVEFTTTALSEITE
jgi:hypothetical protein